MGLLVRALVVTAAGAWAYSALTRRARRHEAELIKDDFEARIARVEEPRTPAPTVEDFEAALNTKLSEARAQSRPHIDINAGDLHRRVGGHPGPNSRMADCCTVMRGALKPGDTVMTEPKSGDGASLTLRYHLAH